MSCACDKVNEETLRFALQTNTPCYFEHVEQIKPWVRKGDQLTATFMCDVCGMELPVLVFLVDGPDPADWWKRKPSKL